MENDLGRSDPERQELLDVCRAIAGKLGVEPASIVERVAAIPAGDGRPGKSFSDPWAAGISLGWVRAALWRAHELQREIGRPVPL